MVLATYGDFVVHWHKGDMYGGSGSYTVTDYADPTYPRRFYPSQALAEKYAARKNKERIKVLKSDH